MLTIIVVIIAAIAVYIALRIYINTLLVRETQFRVVVDKMQKEIDVLIAELNRVTDRNSTIFEEQAQTLSRLLRQSKAHITVLAKHKQKNDSPKLYYTPQEIAQRAHGRKQVESRPADTQQRIIALAERGLRSDAIAQQVGVSISEVEALLSVALDGQ